MSMQADSIPPLDQGGPQALDYPGYADEWLERPVFERFTHQARLHPEAMAIRDRQGCTTYADLLAECQGLAQDIACQVPPGAPVVIALPVDRHYPAAMLAALAAGRPYVPLDLSHPPERLRHILEHCGSRHVLTDTAHQSAVAGYLPEGACLLLHDAPRSRTVPCDWQPGASADDIAYVIYTSGSSGMPKGVYQNQRGLSHDIMQYTRSAHLRPGDVLTGLYSPNVNGALRDIYGALLNGATLLMIDLRQDGLGHARQSILRWGATILHAMPPVMRSFLRALDSGDDLSSVRLVYLAGDKLPASDLEAIRHRLHADTLVYVGIGSTECATLYRQWFVPRDFVPRGALVPSGFPVPDRMVELLDPEGRPVPAGQSGEIFVSSPYLARGYWRDETRSRAQFIPIPQRPGWVRFATGDLGRIEADGLLVFEGRADRQIKIRGYRVEPAETEAALRAMPGVRDAAVVAVEVEDQPRLVAFVVLTEAMQTTHLLRQVRNTLPAHACPAEIVALDELPLLSNFKLDTAALLTLARQRQTAIPSDAPAADAIQGCWCEALQIAATTPGRSFQDEGGDSLKALELLVALEKVLGRHLPVEGFRLEMTLDELSHWLQDLAQTKPAPPPSNQRPHLFIFPPAHGLRADTLLLRNEMASDMDITLVDNPPLYKRAPYTTSIEDLAATLRPEVLRQCRPGQKLVFLGQCCGGRIAHEIATHLQARGLRIDLLVITDLPRTHDRLQFVRHGPVTTLKRCLIFLLYRLLPKRWLLHFRKVSGPLASRSWWHAQLRRLAEACLSRQHSQSWRPQMLHSPSLLLLSASTLQQNPDVPHDLGWASICTDLTVLPMGLGHLDYAQPPNSAALKAMLIKLLAAQTD